MMVLDCSAAVNITRDTEVGRKLLDLMKNRGGKVIAPELFCVETGNAFWKYFHAGLLGEELAEAYYLRTLELVDEYVCVEEFSLEAFSEATQLDHSVYDMVYLVLARRRGAALVTTDRRLAELCERTGVDCFFAAA